MMAVSDPADEMTVRGLLARWPSIMMVAQDLSVPYHTVTAWSRRDCIPARYWDGLLKSARSRRLRGVTFAKLRSIAARKGLPQARERAPASPASSASPTMASKTEVAQETARHNRVSAVSTLQRKPLHVT